MKITTFEIIRTKLIKNNASSISFELNNGNLKMFPLEDLEKSLVIGDTLEIGDWFIEFDSIIAIRDNSSIDQSFEEIKGEMEQLLGREKI